MRICLERAVQLGILTEKDYKELINLKIPCRCCGLRPCHSHEMENFRCRFLEINGEETLQDLTLYQRQLDSTRTPHPTDEEIGDWAYIYDHLLNMPSLDEIKAKYNIIIDDYSEQYD